MRKIERAILVGLLGAAIPASPAIAAEREFVTGGVMLTGLSSTPGARFVPMPLYCTNEPAPSCGPSRRDEDGDAILVVVAQSVSGSIYLRTAGVGASPAARALATRLAYYRGAARLEFPNSMPAGRAASIRSALRLAVQGLTAECDARNARAEGAPEMICSPQAAIPEPSTLELARAAMRTDLTAAIERSRTALAAGPARSQDFDRASERGEWTAYPTPSPIRDAHGPSDDAWSRVQRFAADQWAEHERRAGIHRVEEYYRRRTVALERAVQAEEDRRIAYMAELNLDIARRATDEGLPSPGLARALGQIVDAAVAAGIHSRQTHRVYGIVDGSLLDPSMRPTWGELGGALSTHGGEAYQAFARLQLLEKGRELIDETDFRGIGLRGPLRRPAPPPVPEPKRPGRPFLEQAGSALNAGWGAVAAVATTVSGNACETGARRLDALRARSAHALTADEFTAARREENDQALAQTVCVVRMVLPFSLSSFQ